MDGDVACELCKFAGRVVGRGPVLAVRLGPRVADFREVAEGRAFFVATSLRILAV
jgi:hypothetical protein